MIYEIEIKDGKIISYSGEEEEWSNGELRLVNFLLSAEQEVINFTHRDLDIIQEYYDKNCEHCCWNYSAEDFVEDKDTNYAKITINGETRYYEEW